MHKAKKQITKPFLAALGSYWHLFGSFWLIFQGRMGEALLGSHETPGCLPSWKEFQGPQGKARHEGKGVPEELTSPRGGNFFLYAVFILAPLEPLRVSWSVRSTSLLKTLPTTFSRSFKDLC